VPASGLFIKKSRKPLVLRDFFTGWIVGLELIVRFKKHLENIDFMGKEHIRNAPFFVGYTFGYTLDTHTALQDYLS